MPTKSPEQKLYEAIQAGRIDPRNLNDKGKETLRNYLLSEKREEAQPTKPVTPPVKWEPTPTAELLRRRAATKRRREAEAQPRPSGIAPAFAEKHPTATKVLETVSAPLRWAAETKPGQFLTRAGEQAADVTLMTPRTKLGGAYTPLPTGRQETAADIIGILAGMAAPVGGAYATGGRLATRAGERLLPGASRLAREAIRGAGAGTAYGTARAVTEEQKLPEAAKTIAAEAALFGVGDPAVMKGMELAGRGVKRALYGKPEWAGDMYKPPTRPTPIIPEPPKWERSGGTVETVRPFLPEQRAAAREELARKFGTVPEFRGKTIPIDDRTFSNVGTRKVKAYQWENPEVREFYQPEARRLLGELHDTVKGQKFFGEDDFVTGTKRGTSPAIARILDETKATYKEVEDALLRIIRNEGLENQALAKKIELIIDDNLTYGTKAIDDMPIPPDEAYLAWKGKSQKPSRDLTDDEFFALLEGKPLPVKPMPATKQKAPIDFLPFDERIALRTGARPPQRPVVSPRSGGMVEDLPPIEPWVSKPQRQQGTPEAPKVARQKPAVAREAAVAKKPSAEAPKVTKDVERVIGEATTKPTEAVKTLVKDTDRTYRFQAQEAARRAEDWGKKLKADQLEDIGAAVEKVGNLRTGKTYEQIVREMTPRQRQVLKAYQKEQEAARQAVNEFLQATGEKEYIKFLEDYIPHFYAGPPKKVNAFVTRWARHSPSAKQRTLPTLQHAIDAGLTPVTQNVADLHKRWAAINWRVATNRRFVYELKNIVNAEGLPVIMKPGNAPTDWPVIDHPAIQQIYAKKLPDGKVELWRGGAAVDPEAHKIIRQLLDRPVTGPVLKIIDIFNAFAKKACLSLSLFHHWALTESAQAVLARGRNPFRGLLLIGGPRETLESGLRIPLTKVRITRPHLAGLKALEVPEVRKDVIMHGLQIEAIEDVQIGTVRRGLENLEAKTRNIFGVKHLTRKFRQANDAWDRALWGRYHAGLKVYAYESLVGETLKKAPPDITPAQMRQTKEKIAELVNDMFGGQEWVSKWWLSPNGQRWAQRIFLAPDWSISNISIGGKAITQAKDPVARNITWRYWRNMIATYVATVSAANYALNGKWPEENEHGHRVDIDVTPIMRQMPWHDPNDKSRYYIKPGKQFREVLRYFYEPQKIIGAKFSPAVHTAVEQIAGHQAGSGWAMPWMQEDMDFYESLPDRVKSIAAKFLPFAVRGNNFAFTFPMSKGMTPWKAMRAYEDMIKAQYDPHILQRIWQKGRRTVALPVDWDRLKRELDEAAELNGLDPKKMYSQANSKVRGDYYSDLWEAIDKQDSDKADKAARVLLQLGARPKTVMESGKRRDRTREQLREARGALRRARREQR